MGAVLGWSDDDVGAVHVPFLLFPAFLFCPGEIHPQALYVLEVIACSCNGRSQSLSVTCIVALTKYLKEANLGQRGFT